MQDSLSRTGLMVAIGVFVAMVVDGMDLQMLALALPSITDDLKLTSVAAGALSTYTFLGMAIGGSLAGWLSDRVGRARVVWWAVFVFTFCTGGIELSSEYWEVAVLRFLSGFGIAGLYTAGTLLVSEYAPMRIRTTVLGTLQAGWSVGFVLSALSSSYILPRYGWRPLFFCAIVPGIAALILLWGSPDPPSWTKAKSSGTSSTYTTLWSDRRIRRTFLLWSATSITLQFGFYGANSWLPSYLVKDLGINLQSMGWYVAGTYTMSAVSKVILGWLADRVGRRAVWIATCGLTALYLPVLIWTGTPANAAFLMLIFGFLYGGPYAVNSTYMTESFPPGVRGTAVGLSYNFGRLGSALSPLLIGMLAKEYSIGLGIALLGASYAAAALIPGLFIREKMYDPRQAMHRA